MSPPKKQNSGNDPYDWKPLCTELTGSRPQPGWEAVPAGNQTPGARPVEAVHFGHYVHVVASEKVILSI